MNFRKIFLAISLCVSVFADEQWDADEYIKNSGPQYQWATSYIKKLHLRGDEKILDIGCGDGRITAVMAKSVPKGSILGIDVSESMLTAAQKIHLNNLTFAKQDASHLNFEAEFDLVVSFSCLHWVPDHFAALQGIEKSLKPGGKAFLYFAPDHGRDRFDQAIKTVMESPKWSAYFTGFFNPFSLVKPSKFASYAEEAHLLIQRVEVITVDEIFLNPAAFMAWMTGWMSHLKQLPKELHEEFLGEIIACYLKKHPLDAEGKIHYIDYWMEVELLKEA